MDIFVKIIGRMRSRWGEKSNNLFFLTHCCDFISSSFRFIFFIFMVDISTILAP